MVSMKRTAKTANQTAAACYAARHAECLDLIDRIRYRLGQHQLLAGRNYFDWGYPGDLGRVTGQLARVLASLGDRSAVDAKGLEC